MTERAKWMQTTWLRTRLWVRLHADELHIRSQNGVMSKEASRKAQGAES